MGQLRGQVEWKKFLEGKSLTLKQTIKAQCFVCNGEEGSNEDCKGTSCPLYPYFKKWMRSISRAEKRESLNPQHKEMVNA